MNRIILRLKNYFRRSSIYTIEENGELSQLESILKSIGNDTSFTFFDVGANLGNYTKVVLKLAKKYNIQYHGYLFEPQSACRDILKGSFGDDKNIILENIGFSNTTSSLKMFFEKETSSHASIYKRKIFSESASFTMANFIKGDDYIKKHQIDNIDFVKIDTEGNEYKVIKGLSQSIKRGIIKRIQFEYGGTYLDAGITLKEVFGQLSPYFLIGKITNEQIRILDFSEDLEDYQFSNYLAIHKSCY